MENYEIVHISEYYFKNCTKDFIEMLDISNVEKQTKRLYLCLKVIIEDNTVLIPLRTNLPKNLGLIGYHIPSKSKPNAGFDYRKILIINDDKYLNKIIQLNIPLSQRNAINENYNIIVKQAKQYINGYIKSFNKNRHLIDSRFKFSTLHNFHRELGLKK